MAFRDRNERASQRARLAAQHRAALDRLPFEHEPDFADEAAERFDDGRRMQRRVRPHVLALAVAVLVLAATGFGAYALTREPSYVDSIGCLGAPTYAQA